MAYWTLKYRINRFQLELLCVLYTPTLFQFNFVVTLLSIGQTIDLMPLVLEQHENQCFLIELKLDTMYMFISTETKNNV